MWASYLTKYTFKNHSTHDAASISSCNSKSTQVGQHHRHQSATFHLFKPLHQLSKWRTFPRINLSYHRYNMSSKIAVLNLALTHTTNWYHRVNHVVLLTYQHTLHHSCYLYPAIFSPQCLAETHSTCWLQNYWTRQGGIFTICGTLTSVFVVLLLKKFILTWNVGRVNKNILGGIISEFLPYCHFLVLHFFTFWPSEISGPAFSGPAFSNYCSFLVLLFPVLLFPVLHFQPTCAGN